MKSFHFLSERRKRVTIPKRVAALAIFLLVLPFANLAYLGYANEVSLKDFLKIPLRLSLFSNATFFLPFFVSIGLLSVTRFGWFSFLGYCGILFSQNIYSAIILPGLQNFGALFRTFVWMAVTIYFVRKDISAPYFKMYPRGWRLQKRNPIEMEVKINGETKKTRDVSSSGFYVNWENCNLELNREVDLEFETARKQLKLKAGVVRIDPVGVGFAFRNLSGENRKVIGELM